MRRLLYDLHIGFIFGACVKKARCPFFIGISDCRQQEHFLGNKIPHKILFKKIIKPFEFLRLLQQFGKCIIRIVITLNLVFGEERQLPGYICGQLSLVFRKQWVEKPLVKFLAGLFLSK